MSDVMYRDWGSFESGSLSGARYALKKLTIRPGKRTSVQKHHHRTELWIVVAGSATVEIGETPEYLKSAELFEGGHAEIPSGKWHRITNPGKIDLEIIEVQLGSYFGEDDIVRERDQY